MPEREGVDGPPSQAGRLGDQLYHRLAVLIERGEFAEGGRLPPETELAERFHVSRPVIREALSRLRSVGVIVSRRGSGSFVQKRADRPAEVPASQLVRAGHQPRPGKAMLRLSRLHRERGGVLCR